ncbi:MAG: hypothetical protein WAW27_11905, partial [Chitinophagaceae bacterium]
YYAGLYDRWYKRTELIQSTLIATTVLLAAYALLPEQYRFSRGIVLFGALLAFVLISLLRWVLIKTNVLNGNNKNEDQETTIIAGTDEEYRKVLQLLNEAGLQQRVLGRVAAEENDSTALGYWTKLQELSTTVPFREIIFCEGRLTFANIITAVQTMPKGIMAKIHSTGSSSIVGSNSKDSSGESVSKENGYRLSDPYNRRLKRLIDVSTSFFGIITFPLQLFIVKKPFSFLANCFAVFMASKTWIGYTREEKNLPRLYPGVIGCNGVPVSVKQQLPAESLQMMNYWYARDYEPVNDLKLLWRIYRRLGE